MTPARKLSSTAAAAAPAPAGFFMSDQQAVGGLGSAATAVAAVGVDLLPSIEGLPELRPEDAQYFGKLLAEVDDDELTLEEAKERRIMKLLLKVKNGTPQQRKSALRTLGDKAREFGAGPLFNQILPLLMSPALDDQERHVLVKVVDRVLRKLDELVRPYVHKVLVVVEPLLIDEDYYARIEGREIIANLAKAAGLATMIAAMRPVREEGKVLIFFSKVGFSSPARERKRDNEKNSLFLFLLLNPSSFKNKKTGHRRRRRVRPQHHRPRLRRRRLRAGRACFAALLESSVPLEEIVAGEAHRHQDRAADRDPARLRRATAPGGAGVRGGRRALRRGRPESKDDGRSGAGGPGGSGGTLRHRRVRRRPGAALERGPTAPRESPRGLPQGHRQHHPADGRDLRQLLHARGEGFCFLWGVGGREKKEREEEEEKLTFFRKKKKKKKTLKPPPPA